MKQKLQILMSTVQLNRERYKAEPELDQDACPLQWWISHKASHPTVAKLAAKFLSAPAVSE